MLNLSVSLRKTDPETAVAIAEGAAEGAPEDAHLRSRLSQTFRELTTPDPYAAEATCREFFARFPEQLATEIRPLILEWAVASGECLETSDHGPRNVWLALLSFSDQVGGNTVPPIHAKHLPTITKGLTLVNEALPGEVAARAAAAVLAAGRVVSGTPHLDTAEMLAGELAASASTKDLGDEFSALAQAVWRGIDRSFRDQACLRSLGVLTFNALERAVREARSGSRERFRRGSSGRDRRR
jgi:hypothetical protein